jgi:hypothetical protein
MLLLCLACSRNTSSSQAQASAAPDSITKPPRTTQVALEKPPALVEPTVLTRMPISAYQVSLALDGDAVYLLTKNAAYRLVAGQPAQGIELELGFGAVLTESAFLFWSKGRILRAPKEGGVTREVTKFAHQPQYLVTSGNSFVWIDLSDEGLYTIQTLDRNRPRVLVSSKRELSALAMIHDAVYFVECPTDLSWRIGVVQLAGGQPEYGPDRKGRRPSMFSASETIYYYDVDKTEIRKLLGGVQKEETILSGFVCSPIHVSSRIHCGCVEGLFEVSLETHQPRVLASGRTGAITNVVSNEEVVVWTVDDGRDRVAVNMLALAKADAKSP